MNNIHLPAGPSFGVIYSGGWAPCQTEDCLLSRGACIIYTSNAASQYTQYTTSEEENEKLLSLGAVWVACVLLSWYIESSVAEFFVSFLPLLHISTLEEIRLWVCGTRPTLSRQPAALLRIVLLP